MRRRPHHKALCICFLDRVQSPSIAVSTVLPPLRSLRPRLLLLCRQSFSPHHRRLASYHRPLSNASPEGDFYETYTAPFCFRWTRGLQPLVKHSIHLNSQAAVWRSASGNLAVSHPARLSTTPRDNNHSIQSLLPNRTSSGKWPVDQYADRSAQEVLEIRQTLHPEMEHGGHQDEPLSLVVPDLPRTP